MMTSSNYQTIETDPRISISYAPESEQLSAIAKDPSIIRFFRNPSEKIQLEAVKRAQYVIRYIQHPSYDAVMTALRKSALVAEDLIDLPIEAENYLAQNCYNVLKILKGDPPISVQRVAISKNPGNIRHLKRPNEEIQNIAVKGWPNAISEILYPSKSTCILAVQNFPAALLYVKGQTAEICEVAIKAHSFDVVAPYFEPDMLNHFVPIYNKSADILFHGECTECFWQKCSEKTLIGKYFSASIIAGHFHRRYDNLFCCISETDSEMLGALNSFCSNHFRDFCTSQLGCKSFDLGKLCFKSFPKLYIKIMFNGRYSIYYKNRMTNEDIVHPVIYAYQLGLTDMLDWMYSEDPSYITKDVITECLESSNHKNAALAWIFDFFSKKNTESTEDKID